MRLEKLLPIILLSALVVAAPLALAEPAADTADRGADRGADRKAAQKKYELRVEKQGWTGARQADLRAVYNSACSEIAVHFKEAKFDIEPIRIRHDKSGPIVLYQRSLRGELIVQLSANGTYWCQHAYQIAHEFCHILCRFKPGDRSNLWFEESLCELASIYAMRQMAITWKTAAPYPNWRDYSKSLKSYADDVTKKHALPEGTEFAAWFQENQAQLRKNPTQRELNGIVAVQLLPQFEKAPEGWRALQFLNQGRTKQEQTFREYLEAWHDNTPEKLRPFVEGIIEEFKTGPANKNRSVGTGQLPKG